MPLDLLTPLGAAEQLRRNYIHQLRQTINAYLPAYIFIGESLQNALDSIRQTEGRTSHFINVTMDFNERRVTVRDTGRGFPDQPALLFLGGGDKVGRGLAGMVGVGLKVVLFSSDEFRLQARNSTKCLRVDFSNAHTFGTSPGPTVELPDGEHLPEDANSPFTNGTGTELSYRFPTDPDGIPERFLRDLEEQSFSGSHKSFAQSLKNAVDRQRYPSRLAALIACALRRFTYLGSTVPRPEFDKLTVEVTVVGDSSVLGALGEYADEKPSVTFNVKPRYLEVADTLEWAPTPKPVISGNSLGEGGTNLAKTKLGFNLTTYTRAEEFESLLVNTRGAKSQEIDRFRQLLWPKLSRVTLCIGRIPQFELYLPGGSRRVISARGVITGHDIDISSGQNQQYVRCFDLVVDVNADLNYGKTQLTDMHLVANVRRFVNEAYRYTIQNAARNFVGTITNDTDERTRELFWEREDLGIGPLSQRKVPRDENDVIALFFELTGRGHFDGFHWYGLSSKDPYDSRVTYRPAGTTTPATSSDLRTVEFKLRGASIARDFDREEKRLEEVDLVVCYEIGEPPVSTYQIVDIRQSELGRSEREAYPGVTHVLYDTRTGREIQMLPLREFLQNAYPPNIPASVPEDVQESD